MWEVKLYGLLFQKIAKRQWEKVKDDPSRDGRTEWKRFRWKRLAGKDYGKRHAPDFRAKWEAAGMGGGLKRRFAQLDFLLSWFFLGAEPEDYFSMVFYEKGWHWRNHHVTRMRMNFLRRRFNQDEDACTLLNDKAVFCREWQDMLHRSWCDPSAVSEEAFVSAFRDAGKLIAKKKTGSGGKGIEVYDLAETPPEEVYREVLGMAEPYIVEEYHTQTGWLHTLNPSSLNTIRVATLRQEDGEIRAVFAYLRVGAGGAAVDNLHSGGIRFPVDRRTGEIFEGMNYEVSHVRKHPDTGITVAGEKVPRWEEVLAFCREAHRRAPESLRWIGWDVCLDEEDMSLVEGNAGPGFPPIENPKENWWKEMKLSTFHD